ncbi:MAG: DUF1697 domain-containing protein [Acidimicrobiales bacterium]
MTRFVALIRGVNVGGRKKLGMGDLRLALADLGHTDVETYLQSGNALFTATATDTDDLAQEIEGHLESQLGLDVRVLIRSPADLAEVVAHNPLLEATAEPAKLHVAFLSAPPDPKRLAELDPSTFEPDTFRAGRQEIYLWYPNGSGRTKLTGTLLERRLGLTATARNWNTVVKLLERSSAEAP